MKLQLKSIVSIISFALLFSCSCSAQQFEENLVQEKQITTSTQYICIGDSITNGHGNTSFEAYPHQLVLMLGGANSYKEYGDPNYPERPLPEGWIIQNPANLTTVINHGIESQKIQTMLANIQSQVGSRLGNANETIVILLGGINDVGTGRSAAEIQADWAAYGAWCRANNVKLYIGTMTAVRDPHFNSVKAEANSWLRANWQYFADKLIDFGNNDALADAANLTFFDDDGVHPNETGDLRMAEIVNSVINSTYQTPTITQASLPVGGLQVFYSQTLTVSGGDGTINWSHRSGTLPPGISFNALEHKFEGIPLVIGTYPNIVVRATDATGDFYERNLTISISRKFNLCIRGTIRGCSGIKIGI